MNFLPVTGINDDTVEWIKPEIVLSVGPNPGQRIVTWKDGDRVRVSQRAHNYPDDAFMATLELPRHEY